MVAICARQSVLLMTAYRKCFEPSTVFIRNRLAMAPAEWQLLKLAAERIGAERLLRPGAEGALRSVPVRRIAQKALLIGAGQA